MKNYNFFQKLVHRLVLKSKLIRTVSFDVEKIFYGKGEIRNDSPVFICGLARAGTTILLEAIYSSNQFGSLSYNDMPFVLAPNLWKSINFQRENKKKIERAHGDGIMINNSSPEAFEEIFWETFSVKESHEELPIFIGLILNRYSKSRYLSKNNQNVRRINIIKKIIPEAKFLIVFKHPVEHSFDLLNQHLKFTDAQKKNPFIKEYMDLIFHSEFGLSYKPLVNKNLRYKNFNSINHWLEQWILMYEKLINLHRNDLNVKFVDGGSLFKMKSWVPICKFISIDHKFKNFNDTRLKPKISIDKGLKLRGKKIYTTLKALSI